jgi:chromosome partitioning protein
MADVRPTLLMDMIKPIRNKYDYIIIDTPPALGNLSFNSLVASDYVVIPCEPRPFALTGLSALNKTIKSVKENLNPNLKVIGILLIKYSNRAILNRDIKDMIEDYAKEMDTTVFDATIRESISVPESQISQKPLIDYANSSKPNIDYKNFTTELVKRIGG